MIENSKLSLVAKLANGELKQLAQAKSRKTHCQIQSSDLFLAASTLLRVTLWTVLSLWASLSAHFALWFVGQLTFGLAVLQWFVLLHDFGHGHFFKSKRANWLFGHLASAFCLIPFAPWRAIHHKHHVWTGWQDLDPTMESTLPLSATPGRRRLINFAWTYWFPILCISYSFNNFWNYPRLKALFPRKRAEFVLSIVFLLLVLALSCFVLGAFLFLRTWALGYFIFLVLADPLLLSQHAHIPQQNSSGAVVRPVPVYEQAQYTRSLNFPRWVSHYLLLGFDAHATHHEWPTVPCYFIGELRSQQSSQVPDVTSWWTWLKKAKSFPGDRILFSNNRETRWDL
jgi:fatty acid desaturase